jgi:hypothetical protein
VVLGLNCVYGIVAAFWYRRRFTKAELHAAGSAPSAHEMWEGTDKNRREVQMRAGSPPGSDAYRAVAFLHKPAAHAAIDQNGRPGMHTKRGMRNAELETRNLKPET